jgi:hypothetical protein
MCSGLPVESYPNDVDPVDPKWSQGIVKSPVELAPLGPDLVIRPEQNRVMM